jgi:hypothetical protein
VPSAGTTVDERRGSRAVVAPVIGLSNMIKYHYLTNNQPSPKVGNMRQPLGAGEARKLAREILEFGAVVFTSHCRKELAKDGKSVIDATNVLRAGAYTEAEWEMGAWRHRAFTQRMAVVIEFDTEVELIVVTAFVFRP